ncbi:MAG TPA: ATP-dependent helicase [Arcobacter sp.]|nr:ATP-dependent helicase [Arcobacter sp.]HIP55699.1 ATP-dependent helicase [Arcobacter sp.]
MNITKQQNEIVQAVKKYNNIKINAFAGTGKTSTLKLITEDNIKQKILYLAFNSSIKNEALSIFPSNTHVKTTHGLAYSAIKKHTNINLNNLTNYRAIDISKEFEISYNQAVGALKIFEAFCNSSKDEITKEDTEHKTAKKMFDFMLINKLNPTHSFYLKYYQLLLNSEQISQYSYDIVMLDEAQDTNDVTLSIFEALNSKTKIYVGDEHQQIYSFRGSKNALDKIKCDKSFYLSCSFRFNNDIASFANILLENFKNESVKIDVLKNDDNNIETNGYISRTNATLISVIASRIEMRKPFVTVRDPNEIFTLTIELYYILNNQKNKIRRNIFLKDFDNEDEIIDYTKEVEDYELKSALKVVKEYGDKIFEFQDISKKFYEAWKNKENNGFIKRKKKILFLTTAHTAKGLEWDRVSVADDFVDFADLIVDCGYDTLKAFQEDLETASCQDLLDEFNLFYVSITRAKKVLIKDSENFHYLMSKNIHKLIDARIKESKEDVKNTKGSKKVSASKMQNEDKKILRQQRNQEDGKAKNSGLKWSLEDKIKVQSMYNKNQTIVNIAIKLQRTISAVLGELYKSEKISKKEQNKLSQLIKDKYAQVNKNTLNNF